MLVGVVICLIPLINAESSWFPPVDNDQEVRGPVEAFVLVDDGPMAREKRETRTPFARWESEPFMLNEGERSYKFETKMKTTNRIKRSSEMAEEVKFELKEVEGGKLLQMTRHPTQGTAYAMSQDLEVSSFVERRNELDRSIDYFTEAPRLTSAKISGEFEAVGDTGQEVRFWPRMSLPDCQSTCISQDAKILTDRKLWDILIRKNPTLSAWVGVKHTHKEVDLGSKQGVKMLTTVATIGGIDIMKKCMVSSSHVTAMGEVGILLPEEANRTNLVVTSTLTSNIGIFHPKNGSIADVTWSRGGDYLDSQHLTRYPSQNENNIMEKVLPQLAVIPKPIKYHTFENRTGCFASLNQVTSWMQPRQSCVCQKAAPSVTVKEKDDIKMRQEQIKTLEIILENNRQMIDEEIDLDEESWVEERKEQRSRFTREVDQARSTVWDLDSTLNPLLNGLNERANKHRMSLGKLVEAAVEILDQELNGKLIRVTRVEVQSLEQGKNISHLFRNKCVKRTQRGISLQPYRKLVKVPARTLSGETAEKTMQATAAAVLELQEVRKIQNAFCKMDFIPALPHQTLRRMEENGEKIQEAAGVIYQVRSGVTKLVLLFITEQHKPYLSPWVSYIGLPSHLQVDSLGYFPKMTTWCKKLMNEKEHQDMALREECGPHLQSFPPISETNYPMEGFTLQRFVVPDSVELQIICPDTPMKQQKCEGLCVVRLGHQCEMSYEGPSVEGKVRKKRATTTKPMAKTYELLYMNKVEEEVYRMTTRDVINILISTVISTLTFIMMFIVACIYGRMWSHGTGGDQSRANGTLLLLDQVGPGVDTSGDRDSAIVL